MNMRSLQTMSPKTKLKVRILYGSILCALIVITIGVVSVVKIKEAGLTSEDSHTFVPEPFPLSVDPLAKAINEDPDFESFYRQHLAAEVSAPRKTSFLDHAVAKLALFDWYQNLASPISRILVVLPGERKEEIAKNFSDILKWDKSEREQFIKQVASSTSPLSEGTFYPGRYVVDKDADPEAVARLLNDRFNKEVRVRYSDAIEAVVPLQDALTIASLLEREAYDFKDMRHIAGVIWNRLFIDMNLQIDATLQYAKGSRPWEPEWWPRVRPDDKYIDSPFNTYQNKGLPPAPISNPSVEAIVAALNPEATECYYYFHDRNGAFYCSRTYEEHVGLLQKHYGRGK